MNKYKIGTKNYYYRNKKNCAPDFCDFTKFIYLFNSFRNLILVISWQNTEIKIRSLISNSINWFEKLNSDKQKKIDFKI